MKKILITFSILFSILFVNNILAQAQFSTGRILVKVDSYAALRVFSIDGADTVVQLNRISLLVSGDTNQVWDYWNDIDFDSPTTLVDTAYFGDYEINGIYNNAYKNLPPNILVNQSVFGWNDAGYTIVKATVTNNQDTVLTTLPGLDVVQDMDSTWANDNVYFDTSNNMLVQYEKHYAAVKILSEATTSAHIFDWYKEYSADSNYYNWLNEKTFTTDPLVTNDNGGVGILGGTEQSLSKGESRVIYFAVAVGGSEQEMFYNVNLAEQQFAVITNVNSNESSLPDKFALEQNYPNPFNPSTIIKYQIPEQVLSDKSSSINSVHLSVFDILGREVSVLVNKKQSSGNYEVKWNAENYSSGIYFYTLSVGNFIQTKKMILLK